MQNMKTSAGDLSVSPNTCIRLKGNADDESIPLLSADCFLQRAITLPAQHPMEKLCCWGFFLPIFERFVKAVRQQLGLCAWL